MRTLKTAAIVAATLVGTAVGAQAATVFATDATIIKDGPRGTSNDRENLANALGDTFGDFFELGYGAIVDFTFGTSFTGPGNIVEVTFSTPPKFAETITVQGGKAGVFTLIGTLDNMNARAPLGEDFAINGVFDTLRLTDTSPVRGPTGGYDIDRISVSAIPVPAAGAVLLGGLGMLLLMRRRSA